jgi:hypothetical protein
MLRCPKCSRIYETDAQKFCTHDGGRLERADETPAGFDPNATVHGNYAQFKEMGSPPVPPAPPSEPAMDLNKTVMSQPITADPQSETVQDLVSASKDLAPTSQDLPPPPSTSVTSASLPPLPSAPEDLEEMETVWSLAPPPMPEPEPPAAPAPPALLGASDPFEPDQSFATQISQVPQIPEPPLEAPAPTIVEPPVVPVPPAANPYGSAAQASKLAELLPPPTVKKNRRLGLIFAAVALLLFVFAVALALGGYLYWKNLQQQNANRILTAPKTNGNANNGDTGNRNTNTNGSDTTNKNDNSSAPPAEQETFTNARGSLEGPLAEHYTDFAFNYPKTWKLNSTAGSSNFVDVMLRTPDNQPVESFAVSYYESSGSVAGDRETVEKLALEKSERFAKSISNYQKVSSGETTVNSIAGYEFRFSGNLNLPGSPNIWGRMVFLPPGRIGETSGVTMVMYVTSLSPEVRGVDDVGAKGDLPVILNSFKFGQ